MKFCLFPGVWSHTTLGWLSVFFECEFPSPSSGRDDQLPSRCCVSKEELAEVALLASWTEGFNAAHPWYHCRKKCKISDRIQEHKRRWLTPSNAESTRWEKTLIKKAELEEHMSRNINLGMKYKIFWTGTTANSFLMVLSLQSPYGIKYETSYIVHLCIFIIAVSKLATFSFSGVLLSFSGSLSLRPFQNLVTPLHIFPVRIQTG